MKSVDWIDGFGCLQRSLLPDSALDNEAPAGVPMGVKLVLPYSTEEVVCRLQNELRRRGFWTNSDLRRRGRRVNEDIFAALQAALRVDVQEIQAQYANAEKEQQKE